MLRNSVVFALGDGGLDKVNAMQLIHSVWDLQESLDLQEWRHILWKASQHVAAFDATTVGTMVPQTKSDECFLEFEAKFAAVVKCSSGFNTAEIVDPTTTTKCVATIHAKMTAPILTRWWTVGAATSYMYEYYLQLFYAAQTVINAYKSGAGPHTIASCLFSHVLNQENFIDLTLIRGYHKAMTTPHLDWFQSCQDLTGKMGFQSHNVVTRVYVMQQDIIGLPSHDEFKPYHEAIEQAGHVRGSTEYKRHIKKLTVFVEQSMETCTKHFTRWLSPKLLPEALMSETPLAKVAAAVILKKTLPSPETFGDAVQVDQFSNKLYFKSDVHDKVINLNRYDQFIRSVVDVDDAEHKQEAMDAAQLIID